MITAEQISEIHLYLKSKKLPVDLLLEVQDHMVEQVEVLIDKSSSFEDAFGIAKSSWNYDLEEVNRIFPFKKLTRIEKDSADKAQREIYLNSLKYFSPWAAATILLTFYYPQFFENILFAMYLAFLVAFAFIYWKNAKLIRSTYAQYKGKISIYQRGTYLLSLGAMYIGFFSLFGFTEKFAKLRTAIIDTFVLHDFHLKTLADILMAIIWVWCWTIGFLYLQKYKKAVHTIEDKVTLNY